MTHPPEYYKKAHGGFHCEVDRCLQPASYIPALHWALRNRKCNEYNCLCEEHYIQFIAGIEDDYNS